MRAEEEAASLQECTFSPRINLPGALPPHTLYTRGSTTPRSLAGQLTPRSRPRSAAPALVHTAPAAPLQQESSRLRRLAASRPPQQQRPHTAGHGKLASGISIVYKPNLQGGPFASSGASVDAHGGQPADDGAADEPVGTRLHENAMVALQLREEMRRLVYEVRHACNAMNHRAETLLDLADNIDCNSLFGTPLD